MTEEEREKILQELVEESENLGLYNVVDYKEAMIYLFSNMSVGEWHYLQARFEQTRDFALLGLTGNLGWEMPLIRLIEECMKESERRLKEK